MLDVSRSIGGNAECTEHEIGQHKLDVGVDELRGTEREIDLFSFELIMKISY